MKEKPLLLSAIEIPYIISYQLYKLFNMALAAPFYTLNKATNRFIYADTFKTSIYFNATFCIFRLLAILITIFSPAAISLGLSYLALCRIKAIIINRIIIYSVSFTTFCGILVLINKSIKYLQKMYNQPIIHWKSYMKAFTECVYSLIFTVFGSTSFILLVQTKKLLQIISENSTKNIEHEKVALNSISIFFESLLTINALLLYMLSFLTLWRRQCLIKRLSKATQAQKIGYLYLNVFEFALDLLVVPIALIPLLSGTRTIELFIRLKPSKGEKWCKVILLLALETFADIFYLIPLALLAFTGINIPLLISNIWKESANYSVKNKMVIIRKLILQQLVYMFKCEFPLIGLTTVYLPLCVIYLWRPYLLNIKLDLSKTPCKYHLLARVHYKYMKLSKMLVRDILSAPCLFMSLIIIWRWKSLIYATNLQYRKSKQFFCWIAQRYVIIFVDLIFFTFLLLHLPFPQRWMYGVGIYSFNKKTIQSSLKLKEECVEIKDMAESLVLGIIDLLLFPANAITLISYYRSSAMIMLFKYPNCQSYSEYRKFDKEKYTLLFWLYWEAFKDLIIIAKHVFLLIAIWRIESYISMYNILQSKYKSIAPKRNKNIQLPYSKYLMDIYNSQIDRNKCKNKSINFIIWEFIHDLLYFPIFFGLLFISPWRLYTLYLDFSSLKQSTNKHNLKVKINKNRKVLLNCLFCGFLDDLFIIINILSVCCLWRFPLYVRFHSSKYWANSKVPLSNFYLKHTIFCRSYYCFKTALLQFIFDVSLLILLPLHFIAFWRGFQWVKQSYLRNAPWNSVKKYKKIQFANRMMFIKLSFKGLLDILCTLMCLIMMVTLWKLSYLFRMLKINGFFANYKFSLIKFTELDILKIQSNNRQSMSIYSCIILAFISWVVDIPFMALKLFIYFVCPWRVYLNNDIDFKTKIPRKFQIKYALFQERIESVVYSVLYIVLDYITIMEIIILCLTGVKYSVVSNTFKETLLNDNNLESKILDIEFEILRQFIILICDIALIALCLLSTMLLLRIPSIFSRLQGIVERNIRQSRLLKSSRIYYQQSKSTAKILSVTKNLFVEIMQYMDINDITLLSSTCKKAKAMAADDLIWKKHFNNEFSNFTVMNQNYSYQQRCKMAYKNKIMKGVTYSQSDMDWIMGWRVVIIEEFNFSIISLPHLIVLPLKLIGFLLFPLKKRLHNWYTNVENSHYFLLLFKEIFPEYLDTIPQFRENIEQFSHSFWKMHVIGVYSLYFVFGTLTSVISYNYMLVIYYYCYALSGWQKEPTQINNGQLPQPNALPVYKASYGTAQLILLPVHIILVLIPLYLTVILLKHHSLYIWLPIQASSIIIAINIVFTSFQIPTCFPAYKPFKICVIIGQNIVLYVIMGVSYMHELAISTCMFCRNLIITIYKKLKLLAHMAMAKGKQLLLKIAHLIIKFKNALIVLIKYAFKKIKNVSKVMLHYFVKLMQFLYSQGIKCLNFLYQNGKILMNYSKFAIYRALILSKNGAIHMYQFSKLVTTYGIEAVTLMLQFYKTMLIKTYKYLVKTALQAYHKIKGPAYRMAMYIAKLSQNIYHHCTYLMLKALNKMALICIYILEKLVELSIIIKTYTFKLFAILSEWTITVSGYIYLGLIALSHFIFLVWKYGIEAFQKIIEFYTYICNHILRAAIISYNFIIYYAIIGGNIALIWIKYLHQQLCQILCKVWKAFTRLITLLYKDISKAISFVWAKLTIIIKFVSSHFIMILKYCSKQIIKLYHLITIAAEYIYKGLKWMLITLYWPFHKIYIAIKYAFIYLLKALVWVKSISAFLFKKSIHAVEMIFHYISNAISYILIHSGKLLLPIITFLMSGSGKSLIFIKKIIKYPPRIIKYAYQKYFDALSYIYKVTRGIGRIGEIVLLVFGLVWMFWPLCLPLIIVGNRKLIWGISTVLTGFLIVIGKTRLDKEMLK